MATSANKVGSYSKVFRWRYKDGAGSQDTKYLPVKVSTTFRAGDIVYYDSGSAGVVSAPVVSATDGNVKFSSTKTIAGIAKHDKASLAAVTIEDTIAVVPKDKCEVLARIVGNTSAGDDAALSTTSSAQSDASVNEVYEAGFRSVGTGSDNYSICMGLKTDGRDNFRLNQYAIESDPADLLGLVWGELL